MEYTSVIVIIAVMVVVFLLLYIVRRPDENTRNQRALDQYMEQPLTPAEVGRLYERYIGYLFESEGYDVEYHGAINGIADLGRDLIVRSDDEVYIVQTKYWSRYKFIHEKHIFQLYGSMVHFKFTSRLKDYKIKAVFCTTAKYTNVATKVARVLRVELRKIGYDRTYPVIKCCVSVDGDKIYYLPFDPNYDLVKIVPRNGDFYAHSVKEAAAEGFSRFRGQISAA